MKYSIWLRANTAMFDRFDGSVLRVVPDNPKTGVIKHPAEGGDVLNDVYRELAAHYSALFQKRAGSRLFVFEGLERPRLWPLPAVTFEVSPWH